MAQSSPADAGPGSARTAHHARIGIVLFAIYVVLYAGFMILAAFRPDLMDAPTPLGSVNLAIMYGMGLILAAFVLAVVYIYLCRLEPRETRP